ncbi:MAG: hypothetical protein EBR82_81520 [Caulobacteraceae bacterium]|nr:hypothetical protein [Caulobacteraceae bacterium]
MTNRTRYALAACLLAGCVVVYAIEALRSPTPAPTPNGGLSMRGLFIGPEASADAARLAALCDELAECIELDGVREGGPRLKSGVAFDDLRVAAREARLRGESIGARQPHVKKAIHDYLDAAVGQSGGPVSPEQRSKWVAAYRELSRACADATR